MWVALYVDNLSLHDDLVVMSMGIDLDIDGCIVNEYTNPIMPPTSTFMVSAGERKPVVYRARFECDAPATPGFYPYTVTVSVDHQDTSTGDEVGAALLNNDVIMDKTFQISP